MTNKKLTRKQQDRRKIIQAISSASKLYKKYLVGNTFLYVFDNRYIEVLYKKANFKHLTGVESQLSANSFFKLAIQNKLLVLLSQNRSCLRRLLHKQKLINLVQLI